MSNGFRIRFIQFCALTWKNWLFAKRRWKLTMVQLLSPFFFVAVLLLIDKLPKSSIDNPFNPLPRRLYQPTYEIGSVEKCRSWNDQPCKTVRYALENPQTQPEDMIILPKLMQYVIEESKLPASEFEFMRSEQELVDYVKTHLNETTNAIVFSSLSPQIYNYTIYHNATYDLLTMITPGRKPDNRNEIQIILDKAILRFHKDFYAPTLTNNAEIPSIKFSTRRFPQLGFKGGQNASEDKGSVFFYCGIMVQSIILLYTICQEKDLKLRQGLKIIGLKDSAYWFSVLFNSIVFSIISILVLIASASMFQIKSITHSNFLATFLIYFLFSLAAFSLAVFSSVFIDKAKVSLNVGMLHFILGLLLVAMMSKTNTKEALNDPESVWPWVPQLLSVLFPAYNLGEALCEVDYFVYKKEGYFNLDMLYAHRLKNRTVSGINGTFHYETMEIPSANDALLRLMMNFLVFGFLGFYLDQVLRGTHGEPRRWTFIFSPSYWSMNNEQKTVVVDDDELDAILYENHQPLLQIRNCEKSFQRQSWFRSAGSTKKAVDGVSLYAEENQILAILGHNGAGKSTLINIIIGLLKPDGGDVIVDGLSVTDRLDQVRRVLGICPQHDILWDELTAEEHIYLFAILKNLNFNERISTCESLLRDVDLLSVAQRPVGTFSGGMKRRLSVALSFVGNPRLVILDEPTSGMDPYVRRSIWNLILRMRQGRAILMTSHSMEEADVLGDKIVIISNGRLQTEGTSIELKNRFAGYRLNLGFPKHVDPSEVLLLVEAFVCGSSIVSRKQTAHGTDLRISLPPNCDEQLILLLNELENRKRKDEDLFDTFTVTQTSLEDVFLKVSEIRKL